jgi:hypothetical protein
LETYRSDGRRRLAIESRGTGKRTVRIGYVAAAPLWKASYRLSLPADPGMERARLRGWAVLENFSGQAWHDITLTLLSGNPVTFSTGSTACSVSGATVTLNAAGTCAIDADQAGNDNYEPAPRVTRSFSIDFASQTIAFEAIDDRTYGDADVQLHASASSGLPVSFATGATRSRAAAILDRELPSQHVDLYQPSAAAAPAGGDHAHQRRRYRICRRGC